MCTIALKVVCHDVRILADVTKIDCFAAPSEEEEAIEALEEHSRRLVNGA